MNIVKKLFRPVIAFWKSITITFLVLLLSFATMSPVESVMVFVWSDKLVHVVLYFLLTMVVLYDVIQRVDGKSEKKRVVWGIFFTISIGGITELFQTLFFYPRQGDWFDFLSNIIGVLIAWYTMVLFRKKRKLKL